ncbi:MAG TPA: MarR family transcriptional regulator [Bryobacteraceae bacterium]|nr:MarR family transcriptional regulator [Bryobacteraceae bacterium]
MPGKLAADIKQSKPFRHIEEEALLNLVRTTDALTQKQSVLLDQFGLSAAQYNVLRILRGAGVDGLPCGEIANRMITRDPDITRLLDRLEKRGLANRTRESKDRRVVTSRITQAGLDLLASMDEPVLELARHLLGHVGAKDLRLLIGLLEMARERA